MITLILTKQYWLNYQTDNFQFEGEQNMNNILETNLHLTHAPISIKDFNRIKKAPVLDPELWNEKESLDNASLYIIGK